MSAKRPDHRSPRGWAWGVWIASIAAVSVCVIGVQLDTASLRHPGIARIVPPVFSHYALQTLTAEAIAGKQTDAAYAGAIAMVRRNPVSAEPLAILAIAASLAQRFDVAENAYVLGQGRGWREQAIQRFAAMTAIRSGNPEIAGYRLAALWKGGTAPDTMRQETVEVLSSLQASEAFARMMVQGGGGLAEFIAWAPENMQGKPFKDALRALLRAGYQPDCTKVGDRARDLVVRGAGASATVLWSEVCASGRVQPSGLFDFATPRSAIGPFDWIFPGAAGVDLKPVFHDGTWSLTFTNSDMLAHVAAQRHVALAPGSHVVRAHVAGSAEVRLRMTCATGGASVGQRVTLGDAPAALEVPGGCENQTIAVEVTPGSGTVGPIRID